MASGTESMSVSSHSTSPDTDIYWAATRTRTPPSAEPTPHHSVTIPVAFAPVSVATAPTPTSSADADTSARQGLPSTAVAGIAVGTSVLGILLALLAAFLFLCWRKRKNVIRNRELLRSSITVCLPPAKGVGAGMGTGEPKTPEKDQPHDLEGTFPMPPSGARIPPRRSNSMPAVGGFGVDVPDAHSVSLIPPLRPAPRPRAPQGGGCRGSQLPQLHILPSSSLPGARHTSLQYPPSETPAVPSSVCSLQSQTRPAVSIRRSNTRSSTLVLSQFQSSVASNESAIGPPVVTFIPGAGRHSLPDGIIPAPAMALTPRTSASSLIGRHGKVTIGAASSVEPLASSPSFQDIEEEPAVYTGQTAARNSDGGAKLSRTHSPYPASVSAQSKDLSLTTPAPLKYNKRRSTNARSISPLPPLPSSGDQDDRPVLDRLSWGDNLMPLDLQVRLGSSTSAQPVLSSELPIRSVSSCTLLHEQSSQTRHTTSSTDDNGRAFSRMLPKSWWRGAF